MITQLTSKGIYEKLAATGVRIFHLRLSGAVYGHEVETLWIHPNKTSEEWRGDVTAFKRDSERDKDGAESRLRNDLNKHLTDLGYVEVVDVVADTYEGRITDEKCRIVPDPDHDNPQQDGFGHFGWEARQFDEKPWSNHWANDTRV